MEPTREINHYLLLVKKRPAKALHLFSSQYNASPYQYKNSRDLVHRLQLNGVLLGHYITSAPIFNFMLQNLSCIDETLCPPIELFQSKKIFHHTGSTLEAIFSHRELLKLKNSADHYLNELLISINDCDMDKESTTAIQEDLRHAFDFWLQIIRLIPFRNIALVIVSSTREISFPRYLPANAYFGTKDNNISDGFLEE